MCTVTLFKQDDRLFLFMNRDERHDRAEELPPRFLNETQSIIAPIDPESGGTWIASSDEGYIACLLNGYDPSDITRTNITKSRGVIIADILSATDPFAAAASFDGSHFASFRLIVCTVEKQHIYSWDGEHYNSTRFQAEYQQRAFFITSSSLDEPQVVDARCALFHEQVATYEPKAHHIPQWHYSRDPSPSYAPFMYRDYSRTQSITSVALSHQHKPDMEYYRIPYNVARYYDAGKSNAA
jgi:uncharacterized protein with NRDE domain